MVIKLSDLGVPFFIENYETVKEELKESLSEDERIIPQVLLKNGNIFNIVSIDNKGEIYNISGIDEKGNKIVYISCKENVEILLAVKKNSEMTGYDVIENL